MTYCIPKEARIRNLFGQLIPRYGAQGGKVLLPLIPVPQLDGSRRGVQTLKYFGLVWCTIKRRGSGDGARESVSFFSFLVVDKCSNLSSESFTYPVIVFSIQSVPDQI